MTSNRANPLSNPLRSVRAMVARLWSTKANSGSRVSGRLELGPYGTGSIEPFSHDEIDQFVFVTAKDNAGRRFVMMTDGQKVVELLDDRNVRQGSFELFASAPHFYKANVQSIIDFEAMIKVVEEGGMSQAAMLDVLFRLQNKAMNVQRIALFGAEAVVNEANAEARIKRK